MSYQSTPLVFSYQEEFEGLSAPDSAPSKLSAPNSALQEASNVPKYSKQDLQWILKMVLEGKIHTLALGPTSAPQPIAFPDEPFDRPLKAKSLDLYYGKFHMECYNFCQQCEDYFATSGAMGHKRVLFAAIFVQNRASFR